MVSTLKRHGKLVVQAQQLETEAFDLKADAEVRMLSSFIVHIGFFYNSIINIYTIITFFKLTSSFRKVI